MDYERKKKVEESDEDKYERSINSITRLATSRLRLLGMTESMDIDTRELSEKLEEDNKE